jgi:hypothetical protein
MNAKRLEELKHLADNLRKWMAGQPHEGNPEDFGATLAQAAPDLIDAVEQLRMLLAIVLPAIDPGAPGAEDLPETIAALLGGADAAAQLRERAKAGKFVWTEKDFESGGVRFE